MGFTTQTDFLKNISLFSELNPDELENLIQIVQPKSYTRKETIFQEGDAYQGFYVVATGQVLVYKLAASGKMHVIHIMRQGEAFADVPLFAGGGYPASAQTTDASELLFFPKEPFERFLDSHASVCKKMLRVFARRLRSLNAQIEQLTLHEVVGRLARHLLSELDKQTVPSTIEPCVKLDVSKSMLAAHLNTTLETLSRTLHKLSEDSIIRVSGNKVFISDLKRLRQLAL